MTFDAIQPEQSVMDEIENIREKKRDMESIKSIENKWLNIETGI